MLDFMIVTARQTKSGATEIYPRFVVKRKCTDLMIRGKDFYAIWVEERGLWSTDEDDVVTLVDKELDNYVKEHESELLGGYRILYMWDAESGMIDRWHKYCQQQMRDNYHTLDKNLIFSNHETDKKDYASKRLEYPLEPGPITAYDKIISTLYSVEERAKIEWAIGAIVTGDSKKIQKFMVLYGEAGTGKSTILNIIQQLFHGYYSTFDAQSIGSTSSPFALEAFRTNPLVAIQHDGDLSKLENNARLNSLVSHEIMSVNEKFKASYEQSFDAFLFMGTNRPVRITDAKSGIIRRLIDVTPTGNKLNRKDYKTLTKQVSFELGAIAYHCREFYLSDPGRYDDYIPISMLGASNDFYNFIIDSYHIFKREDGTTLKAAWEMYKTYCDEAKVPYPLPRRSFQEELKNYFREYNDRFNLDDGSRVRSYYSGFRTEKFERRRDEPEEHKSNLIEFKSIPSTFDKECADCIAQYATSKGIPTKKWEKTTSKLSELDTSKLHFVKVPENHIVIDFDIPDENGEKCYERNLVEASKWPATYAELSKSGKGIHLHYIYTGDVEQLSRVYDDKIEVKVFNGNSSLRRQLTKCNDLPIATINSGLPLKGEDKLVNFEGVKNEKAIRTLIKKNLNKESHPGTKPSIDFIWRILEDAYNGGTKYDVSDMKNAVLAFAANSTNQADYCIKLVSKMHFKSDEPSENVQNDDKLIAFYDVEVFPNLFLVNWKVQGKGKPIVRMINPGPSEIEELLKYRLIGFNCRRYDNHMLYARLIGYSVEQLYELSQKIITAEKGSNQNFFFGEAYNISYTDIYDYCAKKQSLKKWEIELGIHHQELGLPWDQPVPKELWTKVAEYCDNDVLATEAVFDATQADFTARLILADIAGGCPNDTTNSLSTKFIFGSNRKPQDQFNYRDMGDTSDIVLAPNDDVPWYEDSDYTAFDSKGRPIFPGYKYEFGKSTYRGEEVGEGGYVYAEPGIHCNVALLDIASMHPASIIAEELFGPVYTKRFREIRDTRIAIKHKDFDTARKMLGGALAKYLEDESIAADLAQALKIVINSVYGLTSAKFANAFRDPRNVDNIVAKRGALFMVNLKHEVQRRGFTVAHIKTDSIKIPDATPEIIQFVMDYGQMYGYTFEHEDTYDRICLVNDAVYIAKYQDAHIDKKTGKEIWWTATGTQFQVPYVFKTLFSKEPIEFYDMCETKSVTSALYLKNNNPDYEETIIDPSTGKETIIKRGDTPEFIGRVGQFCPIKPGRGGCELLRESKDKDGNVKFAAATGTKGYEWLESEVVKTLGKEADIDRSYYNKLVDDAVKAISEYGDFEWFISDEDAPHPPEEELPWYTEDELAAQLFERR